MTRPGLVPYFTFPSIDAAEVVFHAFSTRLGGVSEAPYDSLNLGATTRDDAGDVTENRRLMQSTLGHPLREWIRLEHGNRVRVLTAADVAAAAASPESLPVADAVITDLIGVPLTIYYADCVPLLLVDPRRPAVGLVHAGWRGTLVEVAEHAVRAMGEHFGTAPQQLLAGIASSIGPCCLEVDDDVTAQVAARFPLWQESVIRPLNKGGKSTIDLWELNCLQLERAGVPRRNVAMSRLCTACRKDLFYSFRRDRRDTGRLAMLASLL